MRRAASVVFLLTASVAATACQQHPREQRNAATAALREAQAELEQDLEAAAAITDSDERGEAVAEAREEFAHEKLAAREHLAEAAANTRNGENFSALTYETEIEFRARAKARVAELDARLKTIERRPAAHERATHLRDAYGHLEEARKDLREMEAAPMNTFDDGRLGVTLAINRAWRLVKRLDADTTPIDYEITAR